MDSQEYDEKEIRKHEEKTEEKSAEEKSYEEKYRRDPLGTVVWAFILIWIGLVLLGETTGLLDSLELRFGRAPIFIPFLGAKTWTLIFGGIGVILVIEVVVRLLVPTYRAQVVGTIIAAAAMFALALGNWTFIWPVIIIAIGVSMLLRGIARRQ